MGWQDAVVLVTGASRGIGREVALAAARRGARLGLIARSEEDLDAVRSRSGLGGDRCQTVPADIADPQQATDAVGRITDAFGPVDVLVNNAGIGQYGAFADVDLDDVRHLLDVNVLGAMAVTRQALPAMIERRRGHIVNVGSIAGRVGAPFESVYSATKFALVGWTEALSVELSPFGIGVSLVNPGPVATEFFERRGHTYDRERPKPVPPAEVADAVLDAVDKHTAETFVPSLLRGAVVARHLVPPLYRSGTRRSFAAELSELAGSRRHGSSS